MQNDMKSAERITAKWSDRAAPACNEPDSQRLITDSLVKSGLYPPLIAIWIGKHNTHLIGLAASGMLPAYIDTLSRSLHRLPPYRLLTRLRLARQLRLAKTVSTAWFVGRRSKLVIG